MLFYTKLQDININLMLIFLLNFLLIKKSYLLRQ